MTESSAGNSREGETAATERHVHPLTPEEHVEVVLAVKAMIDVLPEGDDMRGEARDRLVSAVAKLEAHWCAWCPNEIRGIYAEAYNVVVNQGSARLAKKLASLTRYIPYATRGVDDHFRETNEWHAKQPTCTWLDGCRIGPGGRSHDPACPVEIEARHAR